MSPFSNSPIHGCVDPKSCAHGQAELTATLFKAMNRRIVFMEHGQASGDQVKSSTSRSNDKTSTEVKQKNKPVEIKYTNTHIKKVYIMIASYDVFYNLEKDDEILFFVSTSSSSSLC